MRRLRDCQVASTRLRVLRIRLSNLSKPLSVGDLVPDEGLAVERQPPQVRRPGRSRSSGLGMVLASSSCCSASTAVEVMRRLELAEEVPKELARWTSDAECRTLGFGALGHSSELIGIA